MIHLVVGARKMVHKIFVSIVMVFAIAALSGCASIGKGKGKGKGKAPEVIEPAPVYKG